MENQITLKKSNLIISIVLGVLIILTQGYFIIENKIETTTKVDLNTEHIKKLTNIVEKHVELQAHDYTTFNLEQIKEDIAEIKGDIKALRLEMQRK